MSELLSKLQGAVCNKVGYTPNYGSDITISMYGGSDIDVRRARGGNLWVQSEGAVSTQVACTDFTALLDTLKQRGVMLRQPNWDKKTCRAYAKFWAYLFGRGYREYRIEDGIITCIHKKSNDVSIHKIDSAYHKLTGYEIYQASLIETSDPTVGYDQSAGRALREAQPVQVSYTVGDRPDYHNEVVEILRGYIDVKISAWDKHKITFVTGKHGQLHSFPFVAKLGATPAEIAATTLAQIIFSDEPSGLILANSFCQRMELMLGCNVLSLGSCMGTKYNNVLVPTLLFPARGTKYVVDMAALSITTNFLCTVHKILDYRNGIADFAVHMETSLNNLSVGDAEHVHASLDRLRMAPISSADE